MTVTYEWDLEQLEEVPSELNDFDPDIYDHNFCDTFAQVLDMYHGFGPEDKDCVRIVLVRYEGNDVEGETDRAWAYWVNGKLPETFEYGGEQDSGIRVPKRFHKEVERCLT